MADFIPIPPRHRKRFPPDMIVKKKFGDQVLPSVSVRDYLLAIDVTPAEMLRIDTERKAKGMEPLFED